MSRTIGQQHATNHKKPKHHCRTSSSYIHLCVGGELLCGAGRVYQYGILCDVCGEVCASIVSMAQWVCLLAVGAADQNRYIWRAMENDSGVESVTIW